MSQVDDLTDSDDVTDSFEMAEEPPAPADAGVAGDPGAAAADSRDGVLDLAALVAGEVVQVALHLLD